LSENIDSTYSRKEIHNVIIGRCKACGGERIIGATPKTVGKVINKLSEIRTQKCGTYDTWTLAEGYTWDLGHLT